MKIQPHSSQKVLFISFHLNGHLQFYRQKLVYLCGALLNVRHLTLQSEIWFYEALCPKLVESKPMIYRIHCNYTVYPIYTKTETEPVLDERRPSIYGSCR